MNLSESFILRIKEMLLAERRILLKIDHEEEDIDVDGDEVDEIQGNLIIDMCNQLNSRNRDKLLKIEEALQSIENKTYGICQDCESSIPEKRLLLNPYFQTCVSCAEDRELEEKRKRS